MNDTSEVVHNIFWTHPNAVKIINAFNIVFLMDNTYKTNRYRLLLLDIVGATPTEMTFFVAFVYWRLNERITLFGHFRNS